MLLITVPIIGQYTTSINLDQHYLKITKEIKFFKSKECLQDFGANNYLLNSDTINTEYINGSAKFKGNNTTYFGKFRIINNTNVRKSEIIYISNNFLDSILFFKVKESELLLLGSSGDKMSINEHRLKNRLNVFDFSIGPKDTLEFLFAFKENRPIVMNVYLMDVDSFISKSDKDHLFLGAYYGIVFLLAFVGLTAFVFTKKTYFFYYACLVVSGILANSTSNGTWHRFFTGEKPEYSIIIHSFIVTAWVLSYILFTRDFLDYKHHLTRVYKWMNFILISFTLIAIILISLFILNDFKQLSSIMYLMILLTYSIMAIFIIKMIKHSKFQAILLTASFLPMLLGFIIYATLRSGFFHNDFLSSFILQLASLAMIMAITFAIGYAIKREFNLRIKLLNELSEQEKIFNQKIQLQKEKEQYNIANLLHDSFGVKLRNIKSLIGENQLNEAQNEILVFASEMRDLSHSMSPTILDHLFLSEAIEDLAFKYSSDVFRIEVQPLGNEPYLEKSIKIILYNITQEIINNTLKHAKASILSIQLQRHENNLLFSFEDNGKGFVLEQSMENGIGLKSIISRIENLGGKCDIESSENKGVFINIEVPL